MTALEWITALVAAGLFVVLPALVMRDISACPPEYRAPRAELPEAKVVRR